MVTSVAVLHLSEAALDSRHSPGLVARVVKSASTEAAHRISIDTKFESRSVLIPTSNA